MKQEISAGGVVLRKNGSSWDVLIIKDKNGNWTFPKGLIEKGEETLDAAKREIQEEVGISDITQFATLSPVHYMYQQNGLISKNVYYVLFISNGKETLTGQKAEGISDVQWVPLDEAVQRIGYPKTNKKLLEETIAILKQRV